MDLLVRAHHEDKNEISFISRQGIGAASMLKDGWWQFFDHRPA
jgi:hypothetical protein